MAIRDPATGRPLDGGEVGRICLRSGAVMAGYWRDPDATAASLVDGWLLTDDLGWIGDDGCLRVSGRLTEMYIRGGYNVFPQEVEAALAHHPSVASVAVAPRSSDVMGEVGVAVVVPEAASRLPPPRSYETSPPTASPRTSSPKPSWWWTPCRSPPWTSSTAEPCAASSPTPEPSRDPEAISGSR